MVYNRAIKENSFMLKHIPCDTGAGDSVESGGGAFTEGEGNAEGGSTGGLSSFAGGTDGETAGAVNGASAGKMLHNSVQFVFRKPI